MTLAVAIPAAILAAVAYGASTAVQHSAAHTGTGQVDARRLVNLVRNPRWLLSLCGDAVGLILQVIALSTGPVVLVQPLLVLALPVSLPVARMLGGPNPRRPDYLACLGIVAGLAVFFVLLGDPGNGDPLSTSAAAWAIVLAVVVGGGLFLAVRGRGTALRAGVVGAVAGGSFGLVGVLLNSVAETMADDGLSEFGHAQGLVALAGVVIVGALAMTLTQVSFQVGALAAAFPANESAAPVVAVVLGAVLLHEDVPMAPLYVLAYLGCLGAVIVGAIQLARASEREPGALHAGPSAPSTSRGGSPEVRSEEGLAPRSRG